MRRIRTALFMIIAIFMFSQASAFAADNSDTESITLDNYVTKVQVYDENDTIKNIEVRIQQGKADEAKLNAQKPDRNESTYDVYKGLSPAAKKIYVNILPLEEDYKIDKLLKENTVYERLLIEQARNTFYKALLLDEEASLAEQEKKIAHTEYTNATKNYKSGKISLSTLKESEKAYKDAESKYLAKVSERDFTYEDVKNLIGSTDKINLAVTDIKEASLPTYNRNEFLGLIKKYDADYINALKDSEFKQKRYDFYKDDVAYINNAEALQAKMDNINAKTNLDKVTVNEAISSYNEYIDLLNTKGDLEILKLDIDIQTTLSKSMEIKYKHGNVTKLEYDKQLSVQKQAELKWKQSVNDFNNRVGKMLAKIS